MYGQCELQIYYVSQSKLTYVKGGRVKIKNIFHYNSIQHNYSVITMKQQHHRGVITELFYWIALHYTGVPNKLTTLYVIKDLLCSNLFKSCIGLLLALFCDSVTD